MKKILSVTVLFLVLFSSQKSYSQTPFVGEIAAVGFNFAPIGWLKCDGSLVPISEYETLFNLIGTTYGGDGQVTFALPDYRGRTLIGVGQGPGLTNRIVGESAGSRTATLSTANLPAHTHSVGANTGAGTTSSPSNAVLANTGALDKEFATSSNTSMGTTGSAGLATPNPIDISQPYLGINYIISVYGIFPTQN
ncbi:MAG: phage tail protein [Flavobacterium sp.]|nr:phage tail protein [Flavobacterium sp.]